MKRAVAAVLLAATLGMLAVHCRSIARARVEIDLLGAELAGLRGAVDPAVPLAFGAPGGEDMPGYWQEEIGAYYRAQFCMAPVVLGGPTSGDTVLIVRPVAAAGGLAPVADTLCRWLGDRYEVLLLRRRARGRS